MAGSDEFTDELDLLPADQLTPQQLEARLDEAQAYAQRFYDETKLLARQLGEARAEAKAQRERTEYAEALLDQACQALAKVTVAGHPDRADTMTELSRRDPQLYTALKAAVAMQSGLAEAAKVVWAR